MPVHGRKPPNPAKVKPRARDRRQPPAPPSQRGNHPRQDSWCPMVAALHSLRRRRYRLARRYAVMSLRLIAARAA